MLSKSSEKETAIQLRKQGMTYAEILRIVPVAKSSLALWFKDIHLSNPQTQRLTEARRAAGVRGAQAKRDQRIQKTDALVQRARSEIGKLSKRELFLIGASLYWAEGSKERATQAGSQLAFSNMDPQMVCVFLEWLTVVLEVPDEQRIFEIYLHVDHAHRVREVQEYWARVTGVPVACFETVYMKQSKRTTNRKNITDETYFGLLRIKVRQSSAYVRKLAGWAQGIYDAVV